MSAAFAPRSSASVIGRSKPIDSISELIDLLPGCLRKLKALSAKIIREQEENPKEEFEAGYHEWGLCLKFKTTEGITRLTITLEDGVSYKNNVKILDVEFDYSMYDVLTCLGYYDEQTMKKVGRISGRKFPYNGSNTVFYDPEEVDEMNELDDIFDRIRYLLEGRHEYTDLSFNC